MSAEGRIPELPVCAVSAIVLDAPRQQLLGGVRRETLNEARHLYTLSTITRSMPRSIFALLAGGDPAHWPVNDNQPLILPPGQEAYYVGRGEHDRSVDVMAVEWALGKAGIAGVLAAGALSGVLTPVRRSLTYVPDKDTGIGEWTAMLHYEVHLSPDSDLSVIPDNSPVYNPIVWVPAGRVTRAYDSHDVGLLGMSQLDGLFLCINGACMAGAAELLRPQPPV